MSARRLTGSVLLASLASLAIALAVAGFGERWASARWVLLARVSGWAAGGLLLGALAVPPLEAGRRWRRPLGVAAATGALVHAALSLAGPLRDAWPAPLTWPTYRAGLAATGILALLLVTSSPRLVKHLGVGPVWKPLHRLAYVAGALVVLHLLRLPFAGVVPALFYGAAVLLLLGARLVRR